MIIKWYNRDNISDVDMRQAKAVVERLTGKKKNSVFYEELAELTTKFADHMHVGLFERSPFTTSLRDVSQKFPRRKIDG